MEFLLRDFLPYPRAIHRFSKMLSGAQRWAPEKRRRWQQEHLERTLRYAVKYVPYYQRTLAPYESRFNDMIDRLDISALPSITRDTIKDHFEEFQSSDPALNNYRVIKTSGTTGSPALFVVDKYSHVAQFASLWRVLNWAGYRFGDPFVDIRRNPSKSRRAIRWDMRQNNLVFSVFHFKKENLPEYVKAINRFDPVLIKSYPSALALLGKWLLESDAFIYPPKSVLTCAEMLLESQKAVIKKMFKCPLYDFYGQNERAALISTCEHENYHIHEEYSWVEVDQAESMPQYMEEETGEIVATTFHNLAMPLIRYRTGDFAALGSQSACDCGRTYKRIKEIRGRKTDMIVTPDGRYLAGLEHAFMDSPGIHQSQIVQRAPDKLEIKVIKGQRYTEKDRENIEMKLRSFLPKSMRIMFNFVNSIPLGKNGKMRFVISELDSQVI